MSTQTVIQLIRFLVKTATDIKSYGFRDEFPEITIGIRWVPCSPDRKLPRHEGILRSG